MIQIPYTNKSITFTFKTCYTIYEFIPAKSS
jgi:hypothetical protein